jgi:aryl-alcohol dehydrogenase-like predicted oxidoreductase
MNLLKLGTSNLQVSPVCLGTMTFGQQNSEAEAHEQLDFARSQGINFIDTAELYPVPPRAETYSTTETIIGRWLKRQPRDQIILATKVAGPSRGMNWIRGGPKGLDRANIRAALEGSLQRLQTDYIDLYQIHWPARNVPMFGQYRFDPKAEPEVEPILRQLETLDELVREGKIRYIGVSNETPWGVYQFLKLAEERGLPRIVSVQNAYNLLNRIYEHGLAEISYRENLPLLAYSPLAFGHLSGKYLDNPQAPGRITEFPAFGQRYTKENMQPAVAAYCELARQQGLTPTTLALAFVASRPFTTLPIIGATTLDQLKENITACATILTPEILAGIEAIHLRYTHPAP